MPSFVVGHRPISSSCLRLLSPSRKECHLREDASPGPPLRGQKETTVVHLGDNTDSRRLWADFPVAEIQVLCTGNWGGARTFPRNTRKS